jgi:hypothetical protein
MAPRNQRTDHRGGRRCPFGTGIPLRPGCRAGPWPPPVPASGALPEEGRRQGIPGPRIQRVQRNRRARRETGPPGRPAVGRQGERQRGSRGRSAIAPVWLAPRLPGFLPDCDPGRECAAGPRMERPATAVLRELPGPENCLARTWTSSVTSAHGYRLL